MRERCDEVISIHDCLLLYSRFWITTGPTRASHGYKCTHPNMYVQIIFFLRVFFYIWSERDTNIFIMNPVAQLIRFNCKEQFEEDWNLPKLSGATSSKWATGKVSRQRSEVKDIYFKVAKSPAALVYVINLGAVNPYSFPSTGIRYQERRIAIGATQKSSQTKWSHQQERPLPGEICSI